MKFKTESHYIPDLINEIGSRYDEYRVGNKEMSGTLSFALSNISVDMTELFYQYANCLDEEEIDKLIDYQYKKAKTLNVDPECCYHYYNYGGKVSKGVIISNSICEDIFPIKFVISEFTEDGIIYFQRKIELVYDKENDYFIPTNFVEAFRNDSNIIIQTKCNPKVLKREKKYVRY